MTPPWGGVGGAGCGACSGVVMPPLRTGYRCLVGWGRIATRGDGGSDGAAAAVPSCGERAGSRDGTWCEWEVAARTAIVMLQPLDADCRHVYKSITRLWRRNLYKCIMTLLGSNIFPFAVTNTSDSASTDCSFSFHTVCYHFSR